MSAILQLAGRLLDWVGPLSTLLLALCLACSIRALVLAAGERVALPLRILRGLIAVGWLALTAFYGVIIRARLVVEAGVVAIAAILAALVLLPTARRMGWTSRKDFRGAPGPLGILGRISGFLLLLCLVLLSVMTMGYLEMTRDLPVLVVELTGATRSTRVSWSAPGQPARVDDLITYEVLLVTREGELVSEFWVYGDQVGIKGRVLRLAPWLNAAGLPNLFELEFAHNGYRSAERHASMPHQAFPLPRLGPLAVHPWWAGLQRRLLDRLTAEHAADPLVRALTVESTYYPLVDSDGQPVRGVFKLVLTSGGLSGAS